MIQAIETRYSGYRFRSRLEARWAVFFDNLGIPWRYEPQGYQTSHGPYLPDFEIGLGDGREVFVEVKPDSNTEEDPRWHEVAEQINPIYVSGDIPNERDLKRGSHGDDLMHHYGRYWDNCHMFCICEKCGAVGIEFSASWGRITCCKESDGNDGPGNGDHPRILAAFKSARQARFEHGENP